MDPEIEDLPFIDALEMRVDRCPDVEAIHFIGGVSWTWSELSEQAKLHAANLAALGVARGDRILCWLPNCPVATLSLFASAYLGATFVPINPAFRGRQLQHVIATSGARIMLADGALLEHLASVDRGAIKTIVVNGDQRPDLPGIGYVDVATLSEPRDIATAPLVSPRDWETQLVIYTSGTTGPSKGVCCSYRHVRTASHGARNIKEGDRSLSQMPLFHMSGIFDYLWAIYNNGSIVVTDRFRTDQFWDLVRDHRINTLGLLGAMVDFLNAAPLSSRDREHVLKSVVVIPCSPAALQFAERFGVEVYTAYGMTELAVPIFAGPNPQIPGTCGTPNGNVELRIADENDETVPDGQAGELLARPLRPWTMSHAYLEDPVATAAAWRNGWFHTGDIMRRDEHGHFHFVDRSKDYIRRRGENISSFDVECALLDHPEIIEAAVVAVPAPEGSEQEVLAVLRVAKPTTVAALDLPNFLRERLAASSRPRFIRIVDDLPRTPTHKVAKVVLRDHGIDSTTHDYGFSHTRR